MSVNVVIKDYQVMFSSMQVAGYGNGTLTFLNLIELEYIKSHHGSPHFLGLIGLMFLANNLSVILGLRRLLSMGEQLGKNSCSKSLPQHGPLIAVANLGAFDRSKISLLGWQMLMGILKQQSDDMSRSSVFNSKFCRYVRKEV